MEKSLDFVTGARFARVMSFVQLTGPLVPWTKGAKKNKGRQRLPIATNCGTAGKTALIKTTCAKTDELFFAMIENVPDCFLIENFEYQN